MFSGSRVVVVQRCYEPPGAVNNSAAPILCLRRVMSTVEQIFKTIKIESSFPFAVCTDFYLYKLRCFHIVSEKVEIFLIEIITTNTNRS